VPSDPSGAQPKGTLVRNAPDWFDDNLGMGTYILPFVIPTTFNYVAVSLFNNANTGVALKVYAVSVDEDGGGGFAASWMKGPFGTLVGACSPVRPDYPTPYGEIYQETVMVAAEADPNPMLLNSPVAFIGSSGFDSNTVVSPFPLFIVPVGWSLVLCNIDTSNNAGVAFWYQVANE
jgi:hypothetical protein